MAKAVIVHLTLNKNIFFWQGHVKSTYLFAYARTRHTEGLLKNIFSFQPYENTQQQKGTLRRSRFRQRGCHFVATFYGSQLAVYRADQDMWTPLVSNGHLSVVFFILLGYCNYISTKIQVLTWWLRHSRTNKKNEFGWVLDPAISSAVPCYFGFQIFSDSGQFENKSISAIGFALEHVITEKIMVSTYPGPLCIVLPYRRCPISALSPPLAVLFTDCLNFFIAMLPSFTLQSFRRLAVGEEVPILVVLRTVDLASCLPNISLFPWG